MNKHDLVYNLKYKSWKTVKIWPDSTVYILGGGPSLNITNLDLIKDKHVIGVNNAYKLGDWVDVCWFSDTRWFTWHQEALRNFAGLKAHCSAVKSPFVKRLLRSKNKLGIDKNPRYVCWNMHSGGSAINFAYHLGAKRVILLGFDMKKIDISEKLRSNWHEDHPSPDKKNPYNKFLESFSFIKKDADNLGLEILNATLDSAITDFKFVKLEEVYAKYD